MTNKGYKLYQTIREISTKKKIKQIYGTKKRKKQKNIPTLLRP